MADKDELVLVARHGAVVVVTLNRPAAMNALSAALRRELAAWVAAHGEERIADTPLSDWVRWDQCQVDCRAFAHFSSNHRRPFFLA